MLWLQHSQAVHQTLAGPCSNPFKFTTRVWIHTWGARITVWHVSRQCTGQGRTRSKSHPVLVPSLNNLEMVIIFIWIIFIKMGNSFTNLNKFPHNKPDSDQDQKSITFYNAWSLDVNYHGEPVTTDLVNSTKHLTLEAPISKIFNKILALAAQGQCDRYTVVSLSSRCIKQIGCIWVIKNIMEWSFNNFVSKLIQGLSA